MKTNESANVIVPPPVLFLAAWMTAAALQRLVPLDIVPAQRTPLRLLGGLLGGAGAWLSVDVVRHFARATTPVSPLRATRTLVTGGPYRYTRNPDYLGQALIYAGSSLAANRLWPLVLLPAALTIVTRGVIEREERYLSRRFGTAYSQYAARVPRWL